MTLDEISETVHFGAFGNPLPDWRKTKIDYDDDPDDEEVPTTPDVIAILGFDPAEIDLNE